MGSKGEPFLPASRGDPSTQAVTTGRARVLGLRLLNTREHLNLRDQKEALGGGGIKNTHPKPEEGETRSRW